MPNVLSTLRSDKAKSRILLWITLVIIIARGLLSNVVMFDTRAADGHFGLVICSGHGPLFPASSGTSEDAQSDDMTGMRGMDGMQMDGMQMDAMVMAVANPHRDLSQMDGTMQMNGSTQDSAAICAFSAVLFAATVTLAVLLLFSLRTTRRTSYRQGRTAAVASVTPYVFALSRAPPPVLALAL